MSSKVPGSTLFGVVVVVLLIGGLTYAGSQMSSPTTPAQGGADTSVAVPEGIPVESVETVDEPTTSTSTTTTMPTLIFVRSVPTGQQLVQRVSAGSESVLFTDTDLDTNLQAVLGILDKKAIAIFGSDNGALELRSIALDGSGRTTMLNANFGGASGAALSTTTKQVAFATFDNSERSFGFNLVSEQLDGSSRANIATDPQGISLPSWSTDGKQLAYLQGQATPDAGQLIRVVTPGKESTTVFTLEPNMVGTSLTWLDSHSLACVIEPLGNDQQNNAKLYSLDINSKQLSELADLEGKERSLVVADKASWLALVTGDVVAGNQQSTGNLTVIELATGKQQTLGVATMLGAWIND